ncbi:MAG: VWA domain-containing protein [Gammaproteobacteria bacterium]|nr:VWA domain-containing protein [Gammaproteobacteria bacterium]
MSQQPPSPKQPSTGNASGNALNRYSQWDGTQLKQLGADDILNAISEDLMEFGDLQQAIRYLMQRGLESEDGTPIKGLRDLLRQIKEQRRQRLERYDMGSVMEDIRRQLDEILAMEKETINAWQEGTVPDPASAPKPDTSGQAEDNFAERLMASLDLQEDENRVTDDAEADGNFSADVLRDIARKNREFLQGLPDDAAGKVRALQDYEFLNTQAQRKFLKLVDQLRKSMAKSFFNDIEKMVNQMSEGDIQRMKNMVRDLNEMLVKKIAGEDPDFDAFMQKYGDMFGDNPPQSLDDLIKMMQEQMAASQSLINSMSPEQQQQLQELLGNRFGDPELDQELAKLAKELQYLSPGKQYAFTGNEELDLEAAMELMRQMQAIDELEQQMQRAQYDGQVDAIDPDRVAELLGEDARDDLEEMKNILKVLEDAGYARKDGNKWELTPRGTRSLGQKALGEIYARLKKQSLGNHALPEEGRFGERLDASKPYEYGDPLHLHMPKTLRNALDREGPGSPLKLRVEDFEIYRSELITQTATVLMVDLSWSMALRGSFQSAKKVAMALHNLISSSYPRDSLYVLGFSAYAKEIKAHDLPYLQYDDYLLGTNMQHALILAQKLLSKHNQGTRQVIMITDGEPTAHLEDGRPVFAYPPTPATINKTLKAIKQCTAKGITINTFMLDQSYYLKAFVEQMTRINGGRVFYTEPHNLGEYILVDYVQNKKKRIGRK